MGSAHSVRKKRIVSSFLEKTVIAVARLCAPTTSLAKVELSVRNYNLRKVVSMRAAGSGREENASKKKASGCAGGRKLLTCRTTHTGELSR